MSAGLDTGYFRVCAKLRWLFADLRPFYAVVSGLAVGLIIGQLTEYYTSRLLNRLKGLRTSPDRLCD